jgi:hypothetical protein
MMHRLAHVIGFLILGIVLLIIEPGNLPDTFFAEAEAVVGRPITPVSYAGVARRTTRRTVYAASTVYHAPPVYIAPTTTTVVVQDNSYEEQQAAQAQQQAAQAQQQAALAQQQAAEAERRAAEAELQTAQSQQQAVLPVGATLPSLPSGCASTMVNDQSFFSCGGNWFRPAMQNGNIVYAVVADPRKP